MDGIWSGRKVAIGNTNTKKEGVGDDCCTQAF